MVSTCCILTSFLQQKEQDMISFVCEIEKNIVKNKYLCCIDYVDYTQLRNFTKYTKIFYEI